MKPLAKNGLRYPIAPYGIQSDVRAGMGVSYAKKVTACAQRTIHQLRKFK